MPQLSALELLDLQDQLDDLMGKQAGLSGLDLMDLMDEIDAAMAKLGYDAAAAQPEPEPEPEVPEVVTQFLNGEFNDVEGWRFTNVLKEIEPFVGKFLDMEQVITIAAQWWDLTGATEAAATPTA